MSQPDKSENERNFYNEALFILDKQYPELKLETYRYLDYMFERITDVRHLKAVFDRLKEVIKDRDDSIEAKSTEAEGLRAERDSALAHSKRLEEALLKAERMIVSEYCSHGSSCGADTKGCYVDFIYKALANGGGCETTK